MAVTQKQLNATLAAAAAASKRADVAIQLANATAQAATAAMQSMGNVLAGSVRN